MKTKHFLTLATLGALLPSSGCGGDSPCDSATTAHCIEIRSGDSQGLLDAANSLSGDADTTLMLGAGTYTLTNAITIRANGVHIVGRGIDRTTLDFGTSTAQFNGIDAVGDDFLVQDFTLVDAPKDGIRVEASNGVTYRRIKTTWTTPADTNNGAYGIYPVHSQNVLVEDSIAENASDAGLYVGQCQHVVVRRNTVRGNVAGLEIENVQYADVYENLAEDNTGGIVVFDLPGNPIVGHDVRLRDNTIRHNNGVNFAMGGTVKAIPVGTGTFAMASRRVEITGNDYSDNNTVDIAIVSGLIIESDTALWELPTANLVGDITGLNLLPGAAPNTVSNFRSENIVIANNTHNGSGAGVDPNALDGLGLLLTISYSGDPTDSVLYDGIGEAMFHSTDASMNSNTNHLCVGGNTGGTIANMNVLAQLAAQMNNQPLIPFFRPAAPFTPYDCTTLTGGAVAPVVLP